MHKNWVNVAELLVHHTNHEVVSRCVYNLNVIVVKLWANIM